MKEFLSNRGKSYVKELSPLMHADFSTRNYRYDPETQPDGHINMGTAESHLINKEVIALLTKLQSRMTILPKHIHYDYFYGNTDFRTAIANHWQHLIFGDNSDAKITPDNIVIASGCSMALEMLGTVLGDPGDVLLVPAPYYSGFEDDVSERAKVELAPVHCGPELTRSVFEDVYNKQIADGKKVVGVLYSSPNNPIGTVYKPEHMQNVISFCMEHNLEIISDEIYAETIHDPEAKWCSTLSLVPKEYRHHVHVTSSFAKDFALSGIRTGFAISFNPDLITAMQTLSYYSAVSTHTQLLLTELLQASELPELLQRNREELRKGYKKMTHALDEIGIPHLPAQGGIFIFADFSAYMKEHTFEAEMDLWHKIFDELKINISPGRVFAADKPGWFRICYASEPAVVDEMCRRLRTLKKTPTA